MSLQSKLRPLLLLVLAAVARGQSSQEPFVVSAHAYEVNLVFSAADFEGHPVDDLTASNMRLLDAGKRQQQITRFEHHAGLPLRAGIVVDTSGSMQGFALQRNRAIADLFATRILRGGMDEVFVSEFDFDHKLLADWTSNSGVLLQAAARLGHDSGSRLGGTAIYDSLYRTVREQFANQPERTSGTANALLLFSDGEDNTSHAYLKDVVDLCQATQTRIYVFSDQPKSRFDGGEKNLRELAKRTGGDIFYDEQPATALRDLRRIESALRNTYVLVYRPSSIKADGKFHSITLTSPKRGGVISTRTGYYAPQSGERPGGN